jgi:hypothetical protein
MENVLDVEPVYERICKIWVKLKYCSLTLMSTHAPTDEKDEVAEEEFYSSLGKVCDAVPNYMKKSTRGLQRQSWKGALFISSIWRAQPSQQNKL